MHWPLESRPVPSEQNPPFNIYYLESCPPAGDPTMIWGTEVVTTALDDFIRERNLTSPVLLSQSHVLIKAVGMALREFPKLRRRVLRRRVYQYREASVVLAMQHAGQKRADLLLLRHVDKRSLAEIAEETWDANRSAARNCFKYDNEARLCHRLPNWIRGSLLRFNFWLLNYINLPSIALTERQRCASAMVNLLSFPGAPPMRSYKASRFPTDACLLNITMGPTEERPVVESGEVVVRPVAPIFVRADHRVCDAYELARFTEALRELLLDPTRLDLAEESNPELPATKPENASAASVSA